MLHRVTGQGIGQQGEPIGRQRVRNDEDAVVRPAVREVLDGEANEIVPVARDQAAPFLLSPLELLPIPNSRWEGRRSGQTPARCRGSAVVYPRDIR